VAIASVGAGLAANDSTAGTTWAIWGGFGTAVGDFVVAFIASDNVVTTDGNTNTHQSLVTDASEVTWTKVYEFTNGQGAANAGACLSMWLSTACPDTELGPTTVAFSGSLTKKAMVAQRFTVGAGNTLGINAATPATLANDGADPGSLALGSLSNSEHLWVRGIAAETNSDNTVTPSTNWTGIGGGAGGSTTGGGAAANMAAGGEYRILTGTTATSDPTWVSADCASILAAFDEVVGAAASLVIPNRTVRRQLALRRSA
jgi:hypothetical protein